MRSMPSLAVTLFVGLAAGATWRGNPTPSPSPACNTQSPSIFSLPPDIEGNCAIPIARQACGDIEDTACVCQQRYVIYQCYRGKYPTADTLCAGDIFDALCAPYPYTSPVTPVPTPSPTSYCPPPPPAQTVTVTVTKKKD